MQMTEDLAPQIGLSAACQVMGVPRSSLYRSRQPKVTPQPRPSPARALSQSEGVSIIKSGCTSNLLMTIFVATFVEGMMLQVQTVRNV